MSDIETGVRINISNDGLSGARSTAEVLENIANQADKVNQSFDPKSVNEYNKSFEALSQTLKVVESQRAQQTINPQGQTLNPQNTFSPGEIPGRESSDKITDIIADGIEKTLDTTGMDKFNESMEKILATFEDVATQKKRDNQQERTQRISTKQDNIQKAFSQAGNVITQAGAGNVGGAGTSGLSAIMGMISKNPVMAALTGIGLTGAIVGNKLADQYEQRAVPASRIASLEGTLGTDVTENDKALKEAMQSTVDSVARYGKTYEEGIKAREQFLRSGGKDFDKTDSGAYSLFYGSDMGQLSAFEGQTQRYGQEKGLQTTRALLESQDLGAGQFDEVMGGIQDTFSSFLSRGIIKPLEEIAQNQEFFSRAGDTFKGALGSQRLQGMNQVVAGAGRLGSQDDIFTYRAAQELAGDGGIWDTRKELEQGLTPELFQGLIKQYEELGLNQEQQMIKFSDYFGIGATATEELFGLKDQDIDGGRFNTLMGQTLSTGAGKSTVTGAIENQETIKQDIVSSLGESAFATRATIVETGAKIVSSIDNWAEQRDDQLNDAVNKELDSNPLLKRERNAYLEESTKSVSKQFGDDFILSMANSRARKGVSNIYSKVQSAQEFGVGSGEIFEALNETYKGFTSKKSEGGREISKGETYVLETLLKSLITETKRNTEAVLAPTEVE